MAIARESTTSPNKTKDGYELVFLVHGTIDDQEAFAAAYTQAPITFRGFPRKLGAELRWNNRGIAEVSFSYGLTDDDDDPQGELPNLGSLEIDGSGGTQHVNQCIKQKAYPDGKFPDLVTQKVVGWHRNGVNGVDIDITGATLTLTKKWLPAAISGAYITSLKNLRGKVNDKPYTLQWGFNKLKYSVEYEAGELRFLFYRAKTDFTRAGIGVWEFQYHFLESENRTNVSVGSITVDSIKGHEYLWTVYKKKEITNPHADIEVPEAAFVSTLYHEANFKAKLGF